MACKVKVSSFSKSQPNCAAPRSMTSLLSKPLQFFFPLFGQSPFDRNYGRIGKISNQLHRKSYIFLNGPLTQCGNQIVNGMNLCRLSPTA